MDQIKREFCCVFRPRRNDFFAHMSAEEAEVFQQHQFYWEQVANEVEVTHKAETQSKVYQAFVFYTEGIEQAKAIFFNDPAVKEKLLHAKLHYGLTDYVPQTRDASTLIAEEGGI